MTNRHRYHLKWFMVQYKGGCCQLCGYFKLMRNLDFHHIKPSKKDFNFAGSHNKAWHKLRAELDKTICVCRHCHGEIHEALEMLEWGHPDPGILAHMKYAHAQWIPDPDLEYSRDGWEEFHPGFKPINHQR